MIALLLMLAGCAEYEILIDTREEVIRESFDVAGASTDVLFFGDTSFSMQRKLLSVGGAIDQFVDRLEQNARDWQLLAVTGPTGCGVGGIFTPETDDLRARFSAALTTPPDREDMDEWGLFNVYKAVLESGPGGCNAGFVREHAALHVIFFSDEKDTSPGHQLGGDYWRDYVDPILFLKGDAAQVRFSAVVGPTPSGCTTADPGWGYADAATATGGEIIPICDEWGDRLEVVADASVVVAFFALQHEPLDNSLAVSVNDVERETGWTYDAEAGGVRFTEDPPGAWDVVSVVYRAVIEFEVTE